MYLLKFQSEILGTSYLLYFFFFLKETVWVLSYVVLSWCEAIWITSQFVLTQHISSS